MKPFPIVDFPGPECNDPQRLCISTTCPHALTPFIRPKSEHPPSRCARDLPRQMQDHEIAAVLGFDRSNVSRIVREALGKLRKRTSRDWAQP